MKPSDAWLDRFVGMLYYITDCDGVDGKVKQSLEDFVVEEVLLDGQVVPTSITKKPLPTIASRPGPWVWLIVEKRGIDAITLLLLLSKKLGVGLRDISFGGLKDAIAVTSQIISVRGVSSSDVPSELGRDVRVLGVFTMDRPFTTNDIWGNEFTVRIRGVDEQRVENIQCVIEQVMSRGLPTYYGYQRFGIKRPNSHLIGKYILLGDFESAINELLAHPYPMEPPRIREVREFIARTRDYSKALELLPRSYRYYPERAVLKHLASNPRDYVNALRKLPRELLRLYVEAYQSYLFNLALSERIGRGLPINSALPGDLVVLLDEHGLPTKHVIHVTESMVDKVNELIRIGRAAPVGHLLGWYTKIPPGPQGDIELSVLRREGIDTSAFRIKSMPELSIRGGYRPLFVTPIIKEVKVQGDVLTLVFRLPRGNYATVFLREVIKSHNPELAFT
ncbi:MAG: tRNA pseudouridine(13) synthase TruD [Vulcanisaeta sp.]|nr:tRNA pseudouridine(13) synthase TruD [Vulcanisaeta sp.]MCG2869645.1 tRNA pseudouridine(13) synthase TruD [Vulcanisaeta sp.]